MAHFPPFSGPPGADVEAPQPRHADAEPWRVPVEPWHTLPVDETERRLATTPGGLASGEAVLRLEQFGPNDVEPEGEEPWWTLALRQLRDPLVYILLVAMFVTIALRDYVDTGVILAVVVINSVIGFVQEVRAREAMRSLARLTAPRAQVLRDGAQREIASRELVPGDVVLLTSGARVPADLRLTQARDLSIDESLLTGESTPVSKNSAALADPALIPGDQADMAFGGSTVIHGRGRGIVVRTGAATELGRIAEAMRAVGRTATPLQESLAVFGRRVGYAILGLACLVLVVGLLRAMPPAEIFLAAVALAVASIPEGLPVVLTVTLAVGVRRMARRRAIIRALPAVETLGSTTVIGSDKTGTLTKNEMTVRAIWVAGERFDVSGTGYDLQGQISRGGGAVRAADSPALLAVLHAGVLANEADADAVEAGSISGDPTEIALVVAAAKGAVSASELRRRHPELDVLPFESERRLMISLRDSEAGPVEHLKGAPEVVLERCDWQLTERGEEPIARDRALQAAADFAGEGLRVLAMAYRRSTVTMIARESLGGGGFVLAGLVGMDDPVRPEAVAAVADAHRAGIQVLMLTGDHVGTARAVARQAGLGQEALSGSEIERLSDAELDAALRVVETFARVTPEQKLRIVLRLKERHEVVAVTGDGVNDAPALRAAHLGIAMGVRGSDVAREASDMILADDNFATITAAVEEGRIVFANIRKVTFFLLSTAAGEILAILVTLLAGWPLPFTAAQILWINLVTDGLEDVALAFEPGEPGLLHRPPRSRYEGVLTWPLSIRLAVVGVILATVTLGMFWWTLRSTGDLTLARTVAVTQMVVLQFYHTFNCRSLDRSIFRIPLLSNRFLFASMIAVTAVHLSALYLPFLQGMLRFTPLGRGHWMAILACGVLVVAGGELDKAWNRHLARRLG